MARILHAVFHEVIPIYKADLKALAAIETCKRVLYDFLHGPGRGDMALEDFDPTSKETHIVKETEGIGDVHDYIDHFQLHAFCRQTLKSRWASTPSKIERDTLGPMPKNSSASSTQLKVI